MKYLIFFLHKCKTRICFTDLWWQRQHCSLAGCVYWGIIKRPDAK